MVCPEYPHDAILLDDEFSTAAVSRFFHVNRRSKAIGNEFQRKILFRGRQDEQQ